MHPFQACSEISCFGVGWDSWRPTPVSLRNVPAPAATLVRAFATGRLLLVGRLLRLGRFFDQADGLEDAEGDLVEPGGGKG